MKLPLNSSSDSMSKFLRSTYSDYVLIHRPGGERVSSLGEKRSSLTLSNLPTILEQLVGAEVSRPTNEVEVQRMDAVV